MALWGNYDDKTSAGNVNVYANGTVVGNSTFFADPAIAAVGDYITIDATGQNLRITDITSNTICTVVAGTAGEAITNVTAGGEFSLSEKPIYVSTYTIGAGQGEGAANVYGVSIAEVAANATSGIAHGGWVRRLVTVGAGGTGTRTRYETLVAMSGINNDAADDNVLLDFFAAIATQPSAASANLIANANASAVFTVVATVRPETGNVQYYWQVSTDSGSSYSNVTNGATYSGAKTASLNVSAPTGLNGATFRVKIWAGDSGTGFAEITSSNVDLTVAE